MNMCGRWQRKKEVRPGEILDAALKMFVAKGFRATTMEDIARTAGVTKGTPYLYFQNKEDIFKAVVREQLVTRLGSMGYLVRSHTGSAAALLHQLIEGWWNEVGATEAAGICKLMLAEAANFPELASFYYESVIEPACAMTTAILQQGVANGEFRPMSLDEAADALVAPLLMTMLWQHSFARIPGAKSSMNDPLRYLHHALDIMLNGLIAGPQAAGNAPAAAAP